LPIMTLPASSAASCSITGAIVRHGPHQAAHISSNTGSDEPVTTEEKLVSVTITGFAETVESG